MNISKRVRNLVISRKAFEVGSSNRYSCTGLPAGLDPGWLYDDDAHRQKVDDRDPVSPLGNPLGPLFNNRPFQKL